MKVDVYYSVCQTVAHTLSVGCEIVLVSVISIFIKGRQKSSVYILNNKDRFAFLKCNFCSGSNLYMYEYRVVRKMYRRSCQKSLKSDGLGDYSMSAEHCGWGGTKGNPDKGLDPQVHFGAGGFVRTASRRIACSFILTSPWARSLVLFLTKKGRLWL